MEIVLNVRSKTDNSIQESKLPLTGRLVLGRGPDCAVLLDGQGISREHLAAESESSSIFITDLSTNGTWLNGKRLSQNSRCKAEVGDVIEIPGYEIRFLTSGAPAPPELPVAHREATTSVTPVSAASSSFTFLDKFVVLTAFLSFALLVFYLMS